MTSVALFLAVPELLRRRQLQQRYSLIWPVNALVGFFLALFKGALEIIADISQIEYTPRLICVVGLGLVIAIELEKP